MISALNSALDDIFGAMRLRRVWIALAHEDIGDQHRRTTLGPLWLLVNYLAFAGTFVFVFQPAGKDAAGYAAYVAIGLMVWFYLMEVISLSVPLFKREESFIEGTTLPLFVYVMRLTVQSAIRAGYAVAGCVMILLISGPPLTPAWLWSLAGLLLILLTTPALITVFAFIGAFFPDSEFIVGNLMRVGMFFTPVFWVYNGQGTIQTFAYLWNPFTYFLDIARIPILMGKFPSNAFAFTGVAAILMWAMALLLLGRYRRQVVFLI
ncbi:MAG: ABC transporter permease [Mesorhizobium sp.]|nr:MAG: ABC transporter permease [Mesorhizobium sp.]RWL30645.1 MAG: ABC transporter permease [Mesorhizobium sp.]RWL32653.1 MAG: ABC transporter permease [Mesorhizobium sp.]RWL39366.1 MAG: ABC transporter permease [Mesorhizobium sp.]RWL56677.1 MAG: ABC transporter permease [Mesorhizobium sp.]